MLALEATLANTENRLSRRQHLFQNRNMPISKRRSRVAARGIDRRVTAKPLSDNTEVMAEKAIAQLSSSEAENGEVTAPVYVASSSIMR